MALTRSMVKLSTILARPKSATLTLGGLSFVKRIFYERMSIDLPTWRNSQGTSGLRSLWVMPCAWIYYTNLSAPWSLFKRYFAPKGRHTFDKLYALHRPPLCFGFVTIQAQRMALLTNTIKIKDVFEKISTIHVFQDKIYFYDQQNFDRRNSLTDLCRRYLERRLLSIRIC